MRKMSIYYNDRGELTYSYIMNRSQVDENVDFLADKIWYVRKNGLYWIDRSQMFRRLNNKTNVFIENVDFDKLNLVKFIVVNRDTSIFISRSRYFVCHRGIVRYSNEIYPDFDIYRFNFIRNNNKLFSLYSFSEMLFEEVPHDCQYYIQYDNRNFINPHNYINGKQQNCVGNIIVDVEIPANLVYQIGNLFYVIKDEFRLLYVDIPLDDVERVEVLGEQVMLFYKSFQSLYHQGTIYNVPIGSSLEKN